MPNAHHTMSNAEIVSHLVHKARPMHGANGLKESEAAVDDGTVPGAPTAKMSKRKTALSKQIDKNNRKNRLNHGAARK